MDAHENIGFFLSKCCKAHCKAVLTENGEWKLRCEKCGEACVILEEKYSINSEIQKH